MDIGLGLSHLLAMAKKKPHPNKPDKDPAPEIDPVPVPEPDPTPNPDPDPTPDPKPVPDAVIPGVLDAPEIVVLGSPIMEAAFGSPAPAPQIAAYAAEAGFTGRLRVYRDGGEDFAQSRQALQKAQAEVQATEGGNLYLLHSGAETVASIRPYSSAAETLAAEYRELVGAAASKGDKVIPVPLPKTLYGRGSSGYPDNPHDVVDGNPATEAFGTQPYNQEIFHPALRDHAPGWAPDPVSEELAARLSLTVDRASVVAGEAVYLKIEGLTDEEAALWGFLWEFDTSGEFRYLSDLPWHMRQKNRATGHHQTAAWDTPGTKTVTVRIVPPVWSGRKGTVLTVRIENRDPDVEFMGKTAVLDASGVFEGAPAGVRCTTWDEAYAFIKSKHSGRIRLKRGDSYAVTASSRGDVSRAYAGGVMFDAWGNEASPMPVLDIRKTGFNWKRPEIAFFYLVKNIRFEGGYDGITGDNSLSHIAFATAETNPFTINGCEFSHMEQSLETINMNNLTNNMIAFYDCHITAWENYGIYVGSMEKVLIRGCYICQDPSFPVGAEAKRLGGPTNQADHGPIRLTKGNGMIVICSQLRLFSCTGWSSGSTPTDGSGVQPMAHQPVLRLGALNAEGMNALVCEVYSEGGGYSLGGGNAGYTVGSGLVVMQACYHVHTANWNGIGFGTTGTWFHNNIIVVPSVLREDSNNNTWKVFAGINTDRVTETWATKSINVFNNTVAFMASYENKVSSDASYEDIMVPGAMHSQLAMPIVTIHNNVLWAPNITLKGEFEPRVPNGIYPAGSFGPKPLYRGRHYRDSGGTLHFDLQYATPVDGPILPLLSKDSALCGTADRSLASALDFFGRVRGTEPTVGSVERNLSDILDPILDPYELGDRHPQLLGEPGAPGYGLSLGRYLLARVAAGAMGIERGASRAGRSVLYNIGQGHPDEMAIGAVNRIRSLSDYTGFPLLCGAKFQDGGFDPFIEVNVEPDFDTGVTYDGEFSHLRIGEPRFLLDAAINSGLSISEGKTYRLHFGGLTPGDRVTVSCVGITTSTGARRGDLLLTAGTEALTEVLDAASDAASNMATFAPVTVPGTGRISLALTPQADASNAFLSAVLLDFT